jgi:hypothetical protein
MAGRHAEGPAQALAHVEVADSQLIAQIGARRVHREARQAADKARRGGRDLGHVRAIAHHTVDALHHVMPLGIGLDIGEADRVGPQDGGRGRHHRAVKLVKRDRGARVDIADIDLAHPGGDGGHAQGDAEERGVEAAEFACIPEVWIT